jgi:hypothetical protein
LRGDRVAACDLIAARDAFLRDCGKIITRWNSGGGRDPVRRIEPGINSPQPRDDKTKSEPPVP